VRVRLGNGEFEVHPDGKVYARLDGLRRVRDPEILAQLRQSVKEHQESEQARKMMVSKRKEPEPAPGAAE
jgi:hypothetical protein